jgi:hypothetical protein
MCSNKFKSYYYNYWLSTFQKNLNEKFDLFITKFIAKFSTQPRGFLWFFFHFTCTHSSNLTQHIPNILFIEVQIFLNNNIIYGLFVLCYYGKNFMSWLRVILVGYLGYLRLCNLSIIWISVNNLNEYISINRWTCFKKIISFTGLMPPKRTIFAF